MNTATLIKSVMGEKLAIVGRKHGRPNQFLFGERAEAEHTNAQLMSFIKGIRVLFICNPYSQPFTMGFLQMEFQGISDEALVPSVLQGR